MAELTPQDRLQPSLLDRLTDDEPDRVVESRDARVLSPARLRECVRRDLSWLFNTTNLAAVESWVKNDVPVASSVLNYGVPALNGQTLTGMDVKLLERSLRDAILRFEPRLLPGTVDVSLVSNDRMDRHAVIFTIRAELWAQPLPLHLFLRTVVDLDSGEVKIETPRE